MTNKNLTKPRASHCDLRRLQTLPSCHFHYWSCGRQCQAQGRAHHQLVLRQPKPGWPVPLQALLHLLQHNQKHQSLLDLRLISCDLVELSEPDQSDTQVSPPLTIPPPPHTHTHTQPPIPVPILDVDEFWDWPRSTKTECDYLNGWIKKWSHTQKISPRMVNPR